WLRKYAEQIGSFSVFDGNTPNHVLVNEYEPGQGIMPHEDGPLFYPVVSTINLGSHSVLNFYRHIDRIVAETPENKDTSTDGLGDSLNNRHSMSLLLEPRSLLLLTGDLYKSYLHGIDTITQDILDDFITNIDFCRAKLGETLTRSKRVSLTIRYVPKVIKAKFKFGK
ncbi:hypothetical protein QZH41_014728, partial [Actinostola sp. cb2023]